MAAGEAGGREFSLVYPSTYTVIYFGLLQNIIISSYQIYTSSL